MQKPHILLVFTNFFAVAADQTYQYSQKRTSAIPVFLYNISKTKIFRRKENGNFFPRLLILSTQFSAGPPEWVCVPALLRVYI